MSSTELSPILQIYNLTGAEIVDEMGDLNRAWHIRHPSGEYIVKCLKFPPDDYQRQKLTQSCAVMDHLHRQGFPCPKPIQNAQGEFFVEYEGRDYHVITVIDGQGVSNGVTEPQIIQVGELMGNFHRLQHDLANVPAPYDIRGRIRKGMDRIIAEWDTFGMTRVEIREAGHEACLRIDELWQKQSGLPAGLMHTDAQSGNILFEGEQIMGLIDFEVIPGSFLLDLCHSAICWAARFDPANEISHLDHDCLFQFLNAYNRTRRISELEKNVLKDILLLAAIWSWSRQRPQRSDDPSWRLTSRGDIYIAIRDMDVRRLSDDENG